MHRIMVHVIGAIVRMNTFPIVTAGRETAGPSPRSMNPGRVAYNSSRAKYS